MFSLLLEFIVIFDSFWPLEILLAFSGKHVTLFLSGTRGSPPPHVQRKGAKGMSAQQPYDQMSPLERIQARMPSLSKTQKKIATFILDHYDKVSFSTSAKLSRDCGVSESSVIRLATALGYSGYTELQRSLQNILKSQLSMSKRLDLIAAHVTDSDSILHMVLQKGVEGIQRTMLSLDTDNFQKAVDLIAQAKRVFLFGSRSTYALIHFFALELRWIRDNVIAINTQAPEFDALSCLQEGDVFLAISMPRYLKTTTQALALAYQSGIPTIAITDRMSSPLIPYATVPLLVDNEIFSYSDNIVPVTSAVTALLNAVGAATQPKSNEILARNEQVWAYFDLYLQ